MFEKLKNKKILMTGGTSFLGKNFQKIAIDIGFDLDVFGTNYNLTDYNKAKKVFDVSKKYDYIIHAAALQGAADWPLKHRGEQFYVNSLIHVNTLELWKNYQNQATFIGIGSSCSYPGDIKKISENDYWNGKLHESVETYGFTKKMISVGIEAYKKQYSLKGTTVIFATLFGPHDEFNPEKSHVVAALIKKFVDAKINKSPFVEVWGDGSQTRECIFVDDQIKGLLLVRDCNLPIINIGSGIEISLKDLAKKIKKICQYDGDIIFNTNKFIGVKNKVLDISISKQMFGWTTDIKLNDFDQSLLTTINWYKNNKCLNKQ